MDQYKLSKYTWTLNLGDGSYMLYNSLFQKAAKIDKEVKDLLETFNRLEELTKEQKNAVEALEKIGVILPRDFDEIEYLKSVFPDIENSFIIGYTTFIFLLTWDCNLDCTYCLENKYRKSVIERNMTTEMVENAFSFMDKFKGEYIRSLELTGGEPLLPQNRNVIGRIFREGRKRGFDSLIMVTTNSVNLEYYSDLLLKYQDIIRVVRTTMDGTREYHDKKKRKPSGTGSYDEIVQGIQCLIDKGFESRKIHITVRFDRELCKKIENVIETLETLNFIGKVTITFSTIENYDVNPEKTLETREDIWRAFMKYFREHSELLKYIAPTDGTKTGWILTRILIEGKPLPVNPLGCGGISGVTKAAFAPDGKVYFCMVPAGLQEYPVGEYYPEIQVFPETIKNMRKRNFFNLRQCHDCKFMPVCSGGCPYADGKTVTCVAKTLLEDEISEFFYKYMRPQRMKE